MDSSANLFQKNMIWRISVMHIKKTENYKVLACHWHIKEENDCSLTWLDFILASGHGLMISYRFSQFNVTWVSEEFEEKHKSAVSNCIISTFILLGLTDDPPMQVLIFMFLFVSYTLSILGTWPSLYSL